MIDFSQELVRLLKEKAPAGSNPVDIFMDIIPMKKEAAYRRLRGEIPLDLNEALQVALHLDISLDEMIRKKKKSAFQTNIFHMNSSFSEATYCQTQQEINKGLELLISGDNPILLSAFNKLPESYFFKYDHLCKFRLYKFIYQCRKENHPVKLSEIVIPTQIRDLEKKRDILGRKSARHTLWQRDIFHVFATDVRYFHEMGLVTKEDINYLKDDCHTMLDEIERDLMYGTNSQDKPFHVYLSDSYFDCTYLYVESSLLRSCSINVFGINYYMSREETLCNEMKNWIESLMKYSIMISGTGMMERIKFLKEQRLAVDTLI